jgi:YD repeat-containing protein
MDRGSQLILWMFAVALLWAGPAAWAAQKQGSAEDGLIGSWQCQGPYGVSRLVFESKSRLVFDGDPAKYTVIPGGVIRVQDEDGIENYRYTLKGNSLNITFPDGSRLQCQRAASSQAGSVAKGSSAPAGSAKTGAAGAAATAGSQTGKGLEWQLKGMLCSWGGSSSSSSSYSRSTRVSFDGRGGFQYATESSFSSGSGMAYGRNPRPANRGTYRVTGDKVYLTFGDGSSGVAQVHMRQTSGMITEIKYNGELYATGLCN